MSFEYYFPSQIRFIHDDIHPNFRNGNNVNQTIDEILSGEINPHRFPTIEVAPFQNQLYSLNNRRLYVFRVLQYEKKIGKIKVKIVLEKSLKLTKCTTQNYGVYITVRRGETYEHAHASKIWKNSTLLRDLEEHRGLVVEDNGYSYRSSDFRYERNILAEPINTIRQHDYKTTPQLLEKVQNDQKSEQTRLYGEIAEDHNAMNRQKEQPVIVNVDPLINKAPAQVAININPTEIVEELNALPFPSQPNQNYSGPWCSCNIL